MSQVRSHIFRFWLLLLFGSSLSSGQSDTIKVKLTQDRIIDVCSNDLIENSCLIAIRIGQIERSDSLLGYDFWLRYNNVKLRFDRALYVGTLSESFEFKEANIESDGLVRGSGGHTDYRLPPVRGDSPLVVLRFRYLQECSDTTNVELEALEFTDEFQKELDISNSRIAVKAIEVDKPKRYIKADLSVDTLFFEKDIISEFELRFITGSVSRLDTIIADIILENGDAFDILSISAKDEQVEVNFEDSEDKGILKLYNLMKRDTISLTMRIKSLINEEVTSLLEIGNIKTNFCSCITRFESGSAILINRKDTIDDTTTVVSDGDDNRKDITVYYISEKDEYLIESKRGIKKVIIYDLIGREIYNIVSDMRNKEILEMNYFRAGIYLATIITENEEINRIVLIKSYY